MYPFISNIPNLLQYKSYLLLYYLNYYDNYLTKSVYLLGFL